MVCVDGRNCRSWKWRRREGIEENIRNWNGFVTQCRHKIRKLLNGYDCDATHIIYSIYIACVSLPYIQISY